MEYTNANKLHLVQNGLLEKIYGTKYWRVAKEFYWFMEYGNLETRIIVQEGFVTDFGSIPRILRFFFNPTKYVAYILHDKLYSKENKIFTRKESDIALREGLKIEGAGLITRWLVYLGVRIGGRLFFKN